MLSLMLKGAERDDKNTALLVRCLGADGQQLVDTFREARASLNERMRANIAQANADASTQLAALLAAGAVTLPDGRHLLNDMSGHQVTARVNRINSARLNEDGSLWGFLHVETSRNCYTTWEFTWRDGTLKVRSADDLY
ncbi:hypothetical protein DIE18_03035 [Burkholderia sp. Bp9125]|nr:hypothetical protein DIE18_03035 [Burkholderia sp. Bp9125]